MKKQYAAIYQKITGESYDPLKYKELFKNIELLPKGCGNCSERGICKDPCQVIETYVDSDQKKALRETLVEDTEQYSEKIW